MIIIGYQGIGKSTLAKLRNQFIDLESGNFWVNGERPEVWPQIYTNMAVHLAQQNFHVFTSSHKVVRDCIRNHTDVMEGKVKVGVCFPAINLRDDWCKRLEVRYNDTKLDKDYKAWRNAVEMYNANIEDLLKEDEPFIQIPLYDLGYNLREEILKVVREESNDTN